jgi:hypothetical protein
MNSFDHYGGHIKGTDGEIVSLEDFKKPLMSLSERSYDILPIANTAEWDCPFESNSKSSLAEVEWPSRGLGKVLATNFGIRVRVMPRTAHQDMFLDNKIILPENPIKRSDRLSNSMSESIIGAMQITRSKFCVSSEDGQKLYQSIRSALLDGKKALVSFEGTANISSAFLDEVISNLYNGEFEEKKLEQSISYDGLSQEDFRLLENIIDWAKQDLKHSVSRAQA